MADATMTAGGATRLSRWVAGLATILLLTTLAWTAPPATAAVQRIDLRVLVLDDDSPWVDAVQWQLQVEGVPSTAVALGAAGRPVIDAAFLSTGDHAFFQAVVAPSAATNALSAAEWSALRAFEATFSIREVDAYNWPDASVGYAAPTWMGDLAGVTATVTPAAQQSGFGYLSGPVPFNTGSYSFLALGLSGASLPAGAAFTPMVNAAVGADSGAIVGVYTHDGLEQMVITAAMASSFQQFKMLGHGIVSWMTRGVHLGYQRNYLTFHVDDAFSSDALWDAEHNCTPGEDCPLGPDGNSLYPETSARMTADDVAYAVQWEAARQFTLTLAFNGLGIDAAADPLTQSFQQNKAAFNWLNHGMVHIYQGCVQDFTVVPWRCTTDAGGNPVWVSQADIQAEIATNIVAGQSLGLAFDTTEYLSGEHSGLVQLPQQPVDNPNFAAALAALGIHAIGADASREAGSRTVGGALTVPRHPTALYYNTSTAAAAVDEYNWLYTSVANGGSGYCESNPATATCITPLDPATGFLGYIVPTDAAFDLGFVLSNDPRPFYAHTSNMTGDRLLYPLLDTILATYRTSYAASAPTVNQTLTQAATTLARQATWAATSASAPVTAYIEGRTVTVVNPNGTPVPITVPNGTTVAGATLEPYGAEQSAWLSSTTITATLPTIDFVLGGTATFLEGRAGSLTVTSTTPNTTLEVTGTLPTGLVWVNTGVGAYAITGTPAAGTSGSYPLVISATSAAGVRTRAVTLVVGTLPVITSPAIATVLSGTPFTFTITATGSPAPRITVNGTLPSGLRARTNTDGSVTISGTATFTSGGSTRLGVRATSTVGTASQTLTLTYASVPRFTTSATRFLRVNRATSFTVATSASPRATLAVLDPLPSGITFRDRGDGTATVSGTPATGTAGTWSVRVQATNVAGSATQTLVLIVLP